MPEFTRDWLSHDIPIWQQVFASCLGNELQCLEIGCFEGKSTTWLLDNVLTNEKSKITCVDPFESDEELKDVDFKEIKNRFLHNVEKYGDKVELRTAPSVDALRDLIEERRGFDIIYVDGSHLTSDVLTDAVLSHLVLRQAGILIFDDYMWHGLAKFPMTPKAAIDAFMDCFCNEYEVLHIGYQVILKKK